MMETAEADALRLQRVVELIDEDVSGLRILDLACRTGAFSTGLAEAGAIVLGIEGRQDNLDETPPSSVQYVCADIRTIDKATYGTFDVALCLGLLYHLDAKSAADLLQKLATMTKRLVLDTHTSLYGTEKVNLNGKEYIGHTYRDFDTPWGSIGNENSFWFTPESLVSLLVQSGFNSVVPIAGTSSYPDESPDRLWYVALGTAETND